ncbi:hypothetical protein BDZ89DRAFT_1057781 [Hymenopellis radicata]|nr:hypothetical protein BDZ89DRAFT_1057781 [Hymenopellis radicata]
MQGPSLLHDPLLDEPAKLQCALVERSEPRVQGDVPSRIWTLSGPSLPLPIMIRQEYHEIMLGILQWIHWQTGSERIASNATMQEEREPKSSRCIKPEETDLDLSDYLDNIPTPDDLGVVPAPPLSELDAYPNPFLGKEGVTTASGLVLTGLPGIGKSRFLRVVLHLRIAAGLPSLYVPHSPTAALLWKEGKASQVNMHTLHDFRFRNLLPTDTWCLVDSNSDIPTVPAILVESERFIIQAASPGLSRMAWMKKVVGTRYFVMKPWDCGELIAGRQCQNARGRTANETQLADFHHLYGGSARDAYSFAHRIPAFESRLPLAFNRLRSDSIARIVCVEPSSFVEESTSHLVLSFFPVAKQTRTVWKVDSPSKSLRDRLMSRIAKDYEQAQKMWFRFNLDSASPGPRALAARMFDGIYHQHITDGGSWTLRRMVAHENRTPGAKQTTTRGWRTTEDAPKVLVACKEISIQDNHPSRISVASVLQRTFNLDWSVHEPFLVGVYYHCPQRRTFAAFDSFFVDKVGHAIAFQAGIASRSLSSGKDWLEKRGVGTVTYVYVSPSPGPATVSLPLEVDSSFYDCIYHMDLKLW